jgi:hypothetical protein
VTSAAARSGTRLGGICVDHVLRDFACIEEVGEVSARRVDVGVRGFCPCQLAGRFDGLLYPLFQLRRVGGVLVDVGDLHAVAKQHDGVIGPRSRLHHRRQASPHRMSDADHREGGRQVLV